VRLPSLRFLPLVLLAAVLCLPTQAGAATQTFGYTGAEQTYVVPPGVTAIGVEATGSAGADSDAPGGRGAVVSGTVPVTPGQTLYVEVGSGLCNGGGFAGSGAAGEAGNGGGATDLRTVSASNDGGSLCGNQSTASLDSRLIVAAGGGGGGRTGIVAGGAGGDAGQPGGDSQGGATGGGAGTATAGGAGGQADGHPGSLGQGGQGNYCCPYYAGGGGGGGLYGGGGGGYAGNSSGSGGGGGSSLVPDGGTFALASGAPQLVISTTVRLDVATAGPGSVSSDDGAISCGARCAADLNIGTVVVLEASPDPGNKLTEWGGACQGSAPTCQVTMDQARSVTAAFENAAPELTGLTVDPSPFEAGSGSTPLERATGTTIRFTLSEDARVTFRVRQGPPRRDAGPPPRRARRFTRDLAVGENAVPFTGSLGGRTFAPGRYVLIARARDGGGLKSDRMQARFKISG